MSIPRFNFLTFVVLHIQILLIHILNHSSVRVFCNFFLFTPLENSVEASSCSVKTPALDDAVGIWFSPP